jgi:hypothetical protein
MTENPEILQAALEGLEAKLAKINALIGEIKGTTRTSQPSAPESAAVKRTKRKLSPESRERMAEAQRRRWAKQEAEA